MFQPGLACIRNQGLILLLFVGEIALLHIPDILLHGTGHHRVQVGVAAQETGREVVRYTQHVVYDKHLTVDTRTGAYAYCRHLHLLGHTFGQRCGNLLQHQTETSRLVQKMGVVRPYETTNTAEGVKAISGRDQDRMTFKVPMLRNVELTYPYFHDGAVWSLEESVSIMGDLQLGKRYTEQEIKDITAFLKTLTGEQPKIVYPILPPNGPKTPAFNPWAPAEAKK